MRPKLNFSRNFLFRLHHQSNSIFSSKCHSFSIPLSEASQNPSLPSFATLQRTSFVCRENARFFSTNPQNVDPSSTEIDNDDEELAVAPSRAQSDGTSPRFYKEVRIGPSPNGNGYVLLLDNRMLKTPAKKLLVLPDRKLALAIAAEWEYQEGKHIRAYTMPLMRLAATSIDQIPRDREIVINTLIKYFHTDSVLCRAPESTLLADKQAEVWDPLLMWIESQIGFRPIASSNLFASEQPIETVSAMERELKRCNDWQLAAIDSLSSAAKSLIIALAIAKGKLNLNSAVDVIRLEEDYQVQEWGFVEGGHDIDIADLKVRIFAASVFLRFVES